MALLIGIKRKKHRREDEQSAVADAEFNAVRESALRRHGWRCVECGWKSEPKGAGSSASKTTLQVHHVNDDHADNSERNLVPKCVLDHAYSHIGCDAPSLGGHQGMASHMRVIYAPWLSAQDLNLLQMAIAAAMADASLKPVAQSIYTHLMVLSRVVLDGVGTHHAKDFAAALERLSPSQYEDRKVESLRILFHPDLLRNVGAFWSADYPLLPPSIWSKVSRQVS